MASEPRQPLLSVKDLVVEFEGKGRTLRPVIGISYELHRGSTLGVVGESGSGKTLSVLALLGLLPELRKLRVSGDVRLEGRDLLRMSSAELRSVLGSEVGMIFQDPLTSLNPVLKVGRQITEVIEAHREISRDAARQEARALLELVGIANAEARLDQYPHEFSGGMRQRVMIAIAIANRPKLLVADEPTTALDVTIQAQVLEVFKEAQQEIGAAAILITHDLGVIAEVADHVIVMYAGRIVESAPVDAIFHEPRHPYTAALLRARPRLRERVGRLQPIPGRPPELSAIPSGCPFHPRCALRAGRDICAEQVPELEHTNAGHDAACHFRDELAASQLAATGAERSQ